MRNTLPPSSITIFQNELKKLEKRELEARLELAKIRTAKIYLTKILQGEKNVRSSCTA